MDQLFEILRAIYLVLESATQWEGWSQLASTGEEAGRWVLEASIKDRLAYGLALLSLWIPCLILLPRFVVVASKAHKDPNFNWETVHGVSTVILGVVGVGFGIGAACNMQTAVRNIVACDWHGLRQILETIR